MQEGNVINNSVFIDLHWNNFPIEMLRVGLSVDERNLSIKFDQNVIPIMIDINSNQYFWPQYADLEV